MKKLFVLMLAIMPLVFISCSSDDSEDTKQPDKRPTLIVGKWKLTENWKVWQGLGYYYESHWEQVTGELVFSFNSNGSCSISGINDVSCWFPQIDKWEWDDSNSQYPLKLYFPTSGNSGNFTACFSNDNNLEITSGDFGYRFQRVN